MNISEHAKVVLCYGDSNTRGRVPGQPGQRYPANIRWTGLLQKYLGEDYYIIEEGLGGRTTAIDDEGLKNGLTYLHPCLESHAPIDLVVLCLGTNDLKVKYQQEVENVKANTRKLLKLIKQEKYGNNSAPQILLVAPIKFLDLGKQNDPKYSGAIRKSEAFAEAYLRLSEEFQVNFLNAAEYITASEKDGYHIDANAHAILANVIFEKILQIFSH